MTTASPEGDSQEPGPSSGIPSWVAGTQTLEQAPVASWGAHEQEAGSQVEKPELQPAVLMWVSQTVT